MRFFQKFFSIELIVLMLLPISLFSQEKVWTLKKCLEYAHEHNIQIKQSGISVQEQEISKKQSIASLFPTVTGSASMGYSMQRSQNTLGEYVSDNSFNGRYNVGANVTLFNGLKQYNNIQQQKLNMLSQQLNLEKIINGIDISISQAYVQVLYLQEALKNAEKNMESSEAQLTQSKVLLDAGSISQSDYAQVSAQYSSDRYQLVSAQNTLNEQLLQLKQLLELGISDSMNVASVDILEEEILVPVPDKVSVYRKSLAVMPEIKSSEVNIRMADLDYKIARGSYSPTLSASASVGTGNWFDADKNFGSQISDNMNENLSLSLSIPIFNGLQTYSSVQKAKLNRQSVMLDKTATEKDLLITVENVYNEYLSAQSQYKASKEQFLSSELSYQLVEEQFHLGLKNTVELLVEKNNYLSAQQSFLQSKYTAFLALKLLNFYQGIPIE